MQTFHHVSDQLLSSHQPRFATATLKVCTHCIKRFTYFRPCLSHMHIKPGTNHDGGLTWRVSYASCILDAHMLRPGPSRLHYSKHVCQHFCELDPYVSGGRPGVAYGTLSTSPYWSQSQKLARGGFV